MTADDSPVDFGEKDALPTRACRLRARERKMGGFACFVVEKNGRPALERNPRYHRMPGVGITEERDYPLKRPR